MWIRDVLDVCVLITERRADDDWVLLLSLSTRDEHGWMEKSFSPFRRRKYSQVGIRVSISFIKNARKCKRRHRVDRALEPAPWLLSIDNHSHRNSFLCVCEWVSVCVCCSCSDTLKGDDGRPEGWKVVPFEPPRAYGTSRRRRPALSSYLIHIFYLFIFFIYGKNIYKYIYVSPNPLIYLFIYFLKGLFVPVFGRGLYIPLGICS